MRRTLVTLCTALACNSTLDVDVSTAVGNRATRSDPRIGFAAAKQVAQALFAPDPPPQATRGAVELARTVHPPRNAEELDELVTALRKGPIDEVAGPARRLAASERALWPEIRVKILAARKAPKGDYRSLLAAIGGDVPNRYGHFALAWKNAHGFPVKISSDWFEDLLVLPRGRIAPALAGVYRDCVMQAALVRAASIIGRDPAYTHDVVDALLDAAYLHEGTFRDEVGRALVGVGDEAVPVLVRSAIARNDRRVEVSRRGEYAAVILDRMDRLVPERAAAALAAEPRRLAALFDAYGEAQMGEAAALLLEHVDSRTPAVRRAARGAFAGLVDGPPPKTVSRTVRLLGGGTGLAQAYLNHRQRAGIAIRDALARSNSTLLEAPCESTRPDEPPAPGCAEQPARHYHAWIDWLDGRRAAAQASAIEAAAQAGDPDARIAAIDRLLVESPELADTEPVAAIIREGAAAALRRGDAARAAALSRKAAVLLAPRQPELADTLRVQALLAEASLPTLDRDGRAMLLGTATALRPDDPAVATAHTRAERADADLPNDRRPQMAIGAALVMGAFGCLAGIGARRIRAR